MARPAWMRWRTYLLFRIIQRRAMRQRFFGANAAPRSGSLSFRDLNLNRDNPKPAPLLGDSCFRLEIRPAGTSEQVITPAANLTCQAAPCRFTQPRRRARNALDRWHRPTA